jgi:hypothetical protein
MAAQHMVLHVDIGLAKPGVTHHKCHAVQSNVLAILHPVDIGARDESFLWFQLYNVHICSVLGANIGLNFLKNKK